MLVLSMPWEKNFNPDIALDKALSVFWDRGYQASSMKHLLKAMGIQKGSFYSTFSDKKTIFEMVLKKYEVDLSHKLKSLEEKYNSKECLIKLFETIIEEAQSCSKYNGCFLVNTSIELSPHDKEIAKLVDSGFLQLESFIYRMIKEAQDNSEIINNSSPRELARLLVGIIGGMRVFSRNKDNLIILKTLMSHVKAIIN